MQDYGVNCLKGAVMEAYELKDSGVDWISDIPNGWKIDRLKDIANINEKSLETKTPDDYLLKYIEISNVNSRGIISEQAIEEIEFSTAPSRARRKVFLGDTIISSVRPNLQAIAYIESNELNLICSTGFYVVSSKFNYLLDNKFIYYFLLSESSKQYFESIAKGVGYPAVDDKDFKSLYLTLPPLTEQKAIADYLDQACQSIDKTISLKQKQLLNISEQYKSKIIEVIRKGLNKEVALKNSNSEWLGQVPIHWQVKSIKRVTEIIRGKFTHRPRNDPAFYNGNYPFIQTSNVTNAQKYITSYSQTLNEKGYAVSKEFPAGTLTMTIAANIADVAILNFNACFPDSIVGFKPLHMVSVEYLYYMFFGLREDLLSTAILTTQLNLNIVRVGTIKCVIPPKNEQAEIVSYLNALNQNTETLKENIKSQIKTLAQYRQSLIHECVTGKKRVYQVTH